MNSLSLEALSLEATQSNLNEYKPRFFRIVYPAEKSALMDLLRAKPHIQIHNEIESQLKDLVKLRNPKKNLSPEQNRALVIEHIGSIDFDHYGVWVYYPWSFRLVHILDEKEFTEVRTNRNIYKISPDEIIELSKKKIGLIGLSVGQSVALTMSLERGFGELRIADFDELELTNLNRIRTGVHNLGINKSISVAREISEIDPYLNVKCFPDGLHEANMEAFFLEGGKLDLLIDECDGFDIKIICRQYAKKYEIPVLMEASDRGMIDVERFDLEPNRSLLHGLIDHLDISKIKTLKTNEEKVPYLLPFVGIDTISNRAKASMLEIGETITTWPQLASAVTLGGGITADVARRVLLNQFHDSGRYYVDVEELVGPKKTQLNTLDKDKISPNAHLNREFLDALIAQAPIPTNAGISLSPSQLKELSDKVLLAPSAGNNQPWVWLYKDPYLYLFHDKIRSQSFLDIHHFISQTGLGTSIENLELSSRKLDLEVKTEYFPLGDQNDLIARFSFYPGKKGYDSLYDFIGQRCTNRRIKTPVPLDAHKLESLIHSAQTIQGVHLTFAHSPEDLRLLSSIIAFSERERLMDQEAHKEFFLHELKWTAEQAENDKTGIDLRTTDLSLSDIAGLRITKNWEVIELLKEWNVGKGLEKLSHKVVNGASAIGLLRIQNSTPEKYLLAGRAVQRTWLEATRNQVSMQPLLAPISYIEKMHFNGNHLDSSIKNSLMEHEMELRRIFNCNKEETLVFLFRVFEAEEPPVKSYRMDREKLFFNDSELYTDQKVQS